MSMLMEWNSGEEICKNRKGLEMEDSTTREKLKQIEEALSSIDFRRLKKLAKFDGDFKPILKLADACKSLVHAKNSRSKTSWLKVAHALHEKIMSHDPLHINFVDKKRKDGTWCMWLRWDTMLEIGTMSGYSLVASGHYGEDEATHENAAKSFIADFCRVGPDCLKIYNSPYTSERQRLANTAIVAVYKELGCPETAEEVKSKIFANH